MINDVVFSRPHPLPSKKSIRRLNMFSSTLLFVFLLGFSSSVLCQSDNEDDFDLWLERMKKSSGQGGFNNTSIAPAPSPSLVEGRNQLGSKKMILVAKDGSGDFTTVQAAVNSVATDNKERVVIKIKRGNYREKVVVKSSFVTIHGESASLTHIEWNDMALDIGADGLPLGTYGSASVAIEAKAEHFIAKDITFRNFAPPPTSGEVGKQAVALRISADKAAFYRVHFYGAQDTLYDHKGRHYFHRCYIEGSIDFIFGNGRSLYKLCHIHSIASPQGSISAQKRMLPEENTGFSFWQCVVTGSGEIFLGRAWGTHSRVVYSYCFFADIIRYDGWMDWADPARQKSIFYGEFKCFGPGANREGRVQWSRLLTRAQADPFLHIGFVSGQNWLSEY